MTFLRNSLVVEEVFAAMNFKWTSDECNEPTIDLFLLDNGGEQVLVQLIDLTHYKYDEDCIKLNQIVDPWSCRRGPCHKHCKRACGVYAHSGVQLWSWQDCSAQCRWTSCLPLLHYIRPLHWIAICWRRTQKCSLWWKGWTRSMELPKNLAYLTWFSAL